MPSTAAAAECSRAATTASLWRSPPLKKALFVVFTVRHRFWSASLRPARIQGHAGGGGGGSSSRELKVQCVLLPREKEKKGGAVFVSRGARTCPAQTHTAGEGGTRPGKEKDIWPLCHTTQQGHSRAFFCGRSKTKGRGRGERVTSRRAGGGHRAREGLRAAGPTEREADKERPAGPRPQSAPSPLPPPPPPLLPRVKRGSKRGTGGRERQRERGRRGNGVSSLRPRPAQKGARAAARRGALRRGGEQHTERGCGGGVGGGEAALGRRAGNTAHTQKGRRRGRRGRDNAKFIY